MPRFHIATRFETPVGIPSPSAWGFENTAVAAVIPALVVGGLTAFACPLPSQPKFFEQPPAIALPVAGQVPAEFAVPAQTAPLFFAPARSVGFPAAGQLPTEFISPPAGMAFEFFRLGRSVFADRTAVEQSFSTLRPLELETMTAIVSDGGDCISTGGISTLLGSEEPSTGGISTASQFCR